MMSDYLPVARVSEIEEGERKIVSIKGMELGIFNIRGTFHILLNHCPHMGAPLCRGRLTKEIQSKKPGEFIYKKKTILRCPWHGWEFNINTGRSIIDDSIRVKIYEVDVKNGVIYCKF